LVHPRGNTAKEHKYFVSQYAQMLNSNHLIERAATQLDVSLRAWWGEAFTVQQGYTLPSATFHNLLAVASVSHPFLSCLHV
jgi:hypothetical protein